MLRRMSPVCRSFVLLALFGLSSCSGAQFSAQTAKEASHTGADALGDGRYKVGNPYKIGGVWYHPAVDYQYDETGIASWYGPNFHGRRTANGEIFDMNQISAAHRTLPLPSVVRVTNLRNGRSLTLRVNDRGPFARGRILDLSKKAAQALGFQKQGTVRVRVQILAEESRAAKLRMTGGGRTIKKIGSPIKVSAMPKPRVSAEALPPPPESAPVRVAFIQPALALTTPVKAIDARATEPAGSTQMFIQAVALTEYANAMKAQSVLSAAGNAKVSHVLANGRDFYRVRLGPLVSIGQADRTLEAVIRLGYPDAHIVIEK